jgi:hypothetical protein
MFATPDGFHRGNRVLVVRRGDQDRINPFDLLEHLPVIGELLGLGIFLEDCGIWLRSVPPWEPAPMQARLSFWFGEIAPRKPSTAPGAIMNAAVERETPPKNWRRVTKVSLRLVLLFIRLRIRIVWKVEASSHNSLTE